MRHSSSTLEALQRLTSRNRETIEGARQCGCFHCLRVFEASKVTDWSSEVDGREAAALCPLCGIDSVLPARAGGSVDAEVLKAMQAYWFGRAVPSPGRPGLVGDMRQRIAPLLRRLTWDLFGSRKDPH